MILLRSSLLSRAAVVGVAVLWTGCLPHVMHGPRVEDDGVSGSLSLTLGRNREFDDPDARIVPSMYGGLRKSRVPADGEGVAASFGVQVPVLLAPLFADSDIDALDALTTTSYLDVYVQPMRRRDAGFEWGVGALASTAIIGPYAQFGRMKPDGNGWYTTQLVALTIGDTFGEGIFYLPAIAVRHMDAGSSTAGNFSAGLGVSFNERSGNDFLVTLGVTLELGLGRN